MKFVILCTMVKRFGRKGYYNSQEIGVARALVREGHEVVIWKGTNNKAEAEDQQLEPKLLIHYLDMPSLGAHGFMKASRIDPDTDGVLCFSDQQIFLAHIVRYCRRHHIAIVPYVGTTYSIHVGRLRGRVMNWVFAHTTLPMYRRMAILAKTESAKQELTALKVPADHITVSPVGIDLSVMKQDFAMADRKALRAEYGFGEEDVVLLNVARLDPDKRTLELLQMFDSIRQKKRFRLIIVGEGEMREAVDQKIAELKLQGEVRIIPRVPYADMWKIYVLSDYFLNMSLTEIFGMSIMEAIYYQTSVAAMNAIGPAYILKGMQGHHLCADEDEMKHWLLAPAPEKEDLKASAERIAREFSWQTTARHVIRLTEENKAAGR